MKVTFTFLLILVSRVVLSAQEFVAEKSVISFFHEASVEDISARNDKTTCIFDPNSGAIKFETQLADFEFKKSLMKQHFNERYMESEKFPKAMFTGTLTGFQADKPGKQSVSATGQLNVHGVTREVDIAGTAEVQGNRLLLHSKFEVRFEDHHIKIPQLFWKTVAESVEVTVDFTLVKKGE